MLSDRDLWRILLTAPHTQPPEEWIATAKAALSSGPGDTYGTDDYIDLFCRAIVIAFEYYENYARQNDVFYNGALRCESAVSIFEGAVIASGMQSWHVFSSDYSIIDLAKSQSLIQVRTVAGLWEHDGDYCELTYPGHKRGEIESSPTLPVAGEKERIAPWKMAQRISTAASANAQATGGQGGDGGHSLSQSAPIQYASPVAKTGDVNIHNYIYDPAVLAETVGKKVLEGVQLGDLIWHSRDGDRGNKNTAKGRPISTDERRDAERAQKWEKAKAAGVSKADHCEDENISVDDLEATLGRVRKRKKASE